MFWRNNFINLTLLIALSACGRSDYLVSRPSFTAPKEQLDFEAMTRDAPQTNKTSEASLWSGARFSLLGDNRARNPGDILTILIEIDDQAEFSNSSSSQRKADQELAIPQFFGLPQRLDGKLPLGAKSATAVDLSSSSSASGNGKIKRKEKLKLKIAAAIIEKLPNGVLYISGTQETRVNNEMRELSISGFVRPEDVKRNNSISYDKISSARISYGGRGRIASVQEPRIGQKILDQLMPF